jgi:hypothetical protein
VRSNVAGNYGAVTKSTTAYETNPKSI